MEKQGHMIPNVLSKIKPNSIFKKQSAGERCAMPPADRSFNIHYCLREAPVEALPTKCA